MKTNFFKIVMPAAAILLAVGGSFVTKASEKKALAATNGYINPIGTIACTLTIPCNNTPSAIVCTAMYFGNNYQALGRFNPNDTNCIKVLYRP